MVSRPHPTGWVAIGLVQMVKNSSAEGPRDELRTRSLDIQSLLMQAAQLACELPVMKVARTLSVPRSADRRCHRFWRVHFLPWDLKPPGMLPLSLVPPARLPSQRSGSGSCCAIGDGTGCFPQCCFPWFPCWLWQRWSQRVPAAADYFSVSAGWVDLGHDVSMGFASAFIVQLRRTRRHPSCRRDLRGSSFQSPSRLTGPKPMERRFGQGMLIWKTPTDSA